MCQKRNLTICVSGLNRSVHRLRIVACLLVFLELITALTIEQAGLETEIRHVSEHLSVLGERYSEIVRIHEHSLPLGRIEHHLAQCVAILETDHRIVIDGKFRHHFYGIQIFV